MAAQGGGRIIPLAPASAGLRLAMLSYGFVEVTDQPVDFAAITAFTFGVGAVLLVAGLLVSAIILLREFGTLDPRAARGAGARRPRRATACRPERAGRRYCSSTGVPTGTRANSAITSATCMRMHPCDAARADRVVLARAVDADAVGDAHPARLERVGRRAALDRRALQLARPRAVRAPTRSG